MPHLAEMTLPCDIHYDCNSTLAGALVSFNVDVKHL